MVHYKPVVFIINNSTCFSRVLTIMKLLQMQKDHRNRSQSPEHSTTTRTVWSTVTEPVKGQSTSKTATGNVSTRTSCCGPGSTVHKPGSSTHRPSSAGSSTHRPGSAGSSTHRPGSASSSTHRPGSTSSRPSRIPRIISHTKSSAL